MALDMLEKIADAAGVSDSTAGKLAVLASCDSDTVEVVNRILKKDLRINVGLTTARKLMKTLPGFDVCRISDGNPEKLIAKYGVQNILDSIKLNGTRDYIIVDLNAETVQHLSRSGRPYNNYTKLNEELLIGAEEFHLMHHEIHPDRRVVFDGEALVGTGNLQRLMKTARAKGKEEADDLSLGLFDIPFFRAPLSERIRALSEHFPSWFDRGSARVGYIPHTPLTETKKRLPRGAALDQHLMEEALEQGYEGRVWKWNEPPYEHKRVTYWIRVVPVHTADLSVIGAKEGTGKNAGKLGALTVDFNGVAVDIGSGYSDDQRVEFWDNQPDIIEVEYREVTKDGSLLFPRFVRVREDK